MGVRGKRKGLKAYPDLDMVRQEAMAFAKIGLYRYRFDGRVVFMDERALRIFELEDRFPSPADVANRTLADLFVYTTPPGAMRQEIRNRGELHDREWSFKTLKGTLKWVVEDSYLVPDPESGEEAIQVLCRDITDEKRAHRALAETEEKYRMLVDALPFSLSILQDEKIVYANPATLRMLGLESLDQLRGRDIGAGVAESEKVRLREYAQQRIEGATSPPSHYETILLRENGESFPAEVFIDRITFGGRLALQALVIDISERQRAQQALIESEERYRSILENIAEGYYEVDLEGNLTFFNPALCRIFGYPAEELLGLNYRHYYRDEAAIRRAYRTYREVYKTGQPVHLIDWRIMCKNGAEAILEVSINLMRDRSGAPVGFRGIARDVTARKLAEGKLQEAEARYRELFENANDILYTHDLAGTLTSVNKTALEISGYAAEEVLGRSVLDLLAPECRAEAFRMVQRKLSGEDTATRYESVLVSKSGARIPVEVSTRLIRENGVPAGVQGIARDITERKRAEAERLRLEAQIQHTQKLEGLGVLAGGIAHDFNNLLVGILGNAGLALTRLSDSAPARPFVEKIEATAQRAAELTNQMLAYAGKGTFEVRPVHLPTLAREMTQLLAASISKTALLRYDFEPDLPLIRGDIAQLHQVIMNLVTNASDAIGDRSGTITIRTGTVVLEREQLVETYLHDDFEPGPYVCLEVADTGCGMDAETQKRMFDPFFSTKFAGRGLGLAAVLGIVRSHRGAIRIQSQPGAGTTFQVFFPAVPRTVAVEGEAPPIDPDAEVRRWRGNGLVLIVDDEKRVRDVAKSILEHRGFQTLTAVDGREGVRLFAEYSDQIRLVLLDLTMPGLDGNAVLAEIRRMRADVPVILSSGYTKQDVVAEASEQDAFAFIQKPYLPVDLIRIVRDALSTGGGA